MFADHYFHAGWMCGEAYNILRGVRDVATSNFSHDEHYVDTVIELMKREREHLFNEVSIEKFTYRGGHCSLIIFSDKGKEKAKRKVRNWHAVSAHNRNSAGAMKSIKRNNRGEAKRKALKDQKE